GIPTPWYNTIRGIGCGAWLHFAPCSSGQILTAVMAYYAPMKALGAGASRRKALRLVGIYRRLLAGPATRAQIVEALGALYGPNADRAVSRDLETLAGRPFAERAVGDKSPLPTA